MSKNLYKAKRVDDHEWVEGYYLKKIDPLLGVESSFILNQEDMCSFFSWHKVDPSTVCQCIDKKDKNGKCIFEGDILRTRIDIIVKVVFISNIGFCGFYAVPIEGFEYLVPLSSLYFECEVIGNVHDEEWK